MRIQIEEVDHWFRNQSEWLTLAAENRARGKEERNFILGSLGPIGAMNRVCIDRFGKLGRSGRGIRSLVLELRKKRRTK